MSLAQSVQLAQLKTRVMQVNHETREVRHVPIFAAMAKKANHPGPKCKCEACSAMHMQRTRDKRMKAMMPGNVDMGNRQPAVQGKMKAGDMSYPSPNMSSKKVKQVAPPKSTVKKMKPSQLMHDKGKILK